MVQRRTGWTRTQHQRPPKMAPPRSTASRAAWTGRAPSGATKAGTTAEVLGSRLLLPDHLSSPNQIQVPAHRLLQQASSQAQPSQPQMKCTMQVWHCRLLHFSTALSAMVTARSVCFQSLCSRFEAAIHLLRSWSQMLDDFLDVEHDQDTQASVLRSLGFISKGNAIELVSP